MTDQERLAELQAENEELRRELSTVRANNTRLRRRLNPENLRDPRIVDVFEHWQQQCGHPRAQLSAVLASKIAARLREFDLDELKLAIDGAARAAYVDDKNVKHDGLELICRNADKVRLFIARAQATTAPVDVARKLVA